MNFPTIQPGRTSLLRDIREARETQERSPETNRPEQARPPQYDEYVPTDKALNQPIGIYRVVPEADGAPGIAFDAPEAVPSPEADAPELPRETDETPDGSQEPDKAAPQKGGKKPETCTVNTDQVDREIKKLKEKRKELQQRIQREQDPDKKRQLEKQLSQIESELKRKDNDNYRKQHMKVSYS